MAHLRVTVTGAGKAALERAVHEVMAHEVAPELERTAKRLAPVRTGALRDSIETKVDGTDISLYSDLEYASEVELGTSDTPAQSYLRAALNQVRL